MPVQRPDPAYANIQAFKASSRHANPNAVHCVVALVYNTHAILVPHPDAKDKFLRVINPLVQLIEPSQRPQTISVDYRSFKLTESQQCTKLLRPDDQMWVNDIMMHQDYPSLFSMNVQMISYNCELVTDQIGTLHIPDKQSSRLFVNFVYKNKFTEAAVYAHNIERLPDDSQQQNQLASGSFLKFTAVPVKSELMLRSKEWHIIWATIIPWKEISTILCQQVSQTSHKHHVKLWTDYNKAALASDAMINFYQTKKQTLPGAKMTIIDARPPMTVSFAMSLRDKVNFKPRETMSVHVSLSKRPDTTQNKDFKARGVITELKLDRDVLRIIVQLSRGASHEALVNGIDDQPDNLYDIRPVSDLAKYKQTLVALTGAPAHYNKVSRDPTSQNYLKVLQTFFGIRTDIYKLPAKEVTD